MTLIDPDHEKAFWLGLTDQQRENTFQWEDGTDLSYSYWGRNEPDYKWLRGDCVELRMDRDGDWNDDHCSSKGIFPLCQIVIQK